MLSLAHFSFMFSYSSEFSILLIKYCHIDISPVLFKDTVKLQESTVLELLNKQIRTTRGKNL